MKYILDTNTCVFWIKDVAAVKDNINSHHRDDITTTIITVCELYYGLARSESPHKEHNRRQIDNLIGEIGYETITEKAAEIFGEVKNMLRKSGKILDDFDLLIAAITLSLDAVLITDNVKHFQRIERLKIEDWK